MLVHIFVGSLLPYIEGLDSWIFEGTLDDPFEEVILIQAEFILKPETISSLQYMPEILSWRNGKAPMLTIFAKISLDAMMKTVVWHMN